jgi:hypothetical protein
MSFLTYYLGLLFNQPTKFSPKLRDECCYHFHPQRFPSELLHLGGKFKIDDFRKLLITMEECIEGQNSKITLSRSYPFFPKSS